MFKKISILITLILLVLIPNLYRGNKHYQNEVTFWTLQMSDFAPYINGVIADFEVKNPNIKIKWVDVPFSEGEKRTLASVLSDNPPDLVNLNPDFSSTLAQKGALYEIPNEYLNSFEPEILKSLIINDKIYSIPWYATSSITIYNKELFDKAKLSVPKTYTELADIAKKFKKTTGRYITLPNITENDTILKILNKCGCSTTTDLVSDKCIQVFEMYKIMYEKDYIPKETITVTLQEALEKYMTGNIGMITAGSNFLNLIKENAPNIYNKTGVSTQLTGSAGQYDFSLMNFVIPLKAKHKDEALKFVQFLTNEENQLKLAKLTNILAVNSQALNNDFYKKASTNDLFVTARIISAKQLTKLQPVFKSQKNQKEINNIINAAVQNILLGKNNTYAIIKEITTDLNALER